MNDQIKQKTEQFMNDAKEGRIPENVQTFAKEGVEKTREAYDRFSSLAKDQAKVSEDILKATQDGAKAISSKLFDNAAANTEAIFDVASSIARARSIPEAVRIQAEFFQKQMTTASSQTRELFELSTRVTQQTMEKVNTAATQSVDQMRKAS